MNMGGREGRDSRLGSGQRYGQISSELGAISSQLSHERGGARRGRKNQFRDEAWLAPGQAGQAVGWAHQAAVDLASEYGARPSPARRYQGLDLRTRLSPLEPRAASGIPTGICQPHSVPSPHRTPDLNAATRVPLPCSPLFSTAGPDWVLAGSKRLHPYQLLQTHSTPSTA